MRGASHIKTKKLRDSRFDALALLASDILSQAKSCDTSCLLLSDAIMILLGSGKNRLKIRGKIPMLVRCRPLCLITFYTSTGLL